ncbi:50S ribosomal protein L21e [Candidatus Woesearchaeota archaeon]|nr:50S ribosomal protein L21e [Candidatus Woesearchaeota archaeon]
MTKRIGSARRKTRSKLSKNVRRKGKISLSRYFQTFREDDVVRLIAEPAYQNGMYHPRFHNKAGVIKGKKGECYEVMIKDGKKEKMLIVHPVHLKRI